MVCLLEFVSFSPLVFFFSFSLLPSDRAEFSFLVVFPLTNHTPLMPCSAEASGPRRHPRREFSPEKGWEVTGRGLQSCLGQSGQGKVFQFWENVWKRCCWGLNRQRQRDVWVGEPCLALGSGVCSGFAWSCRLLRQLCLRQKGCWGGSGAGAGDALVVHCADRRKKLWLYF